MIMGPPIVKMPIYPHRTWLSKGHRWSRTCSIRIQLELQSNFIAQRGISTGPQRGIIRRANTFHLH